MAAHVKETHTDNTMMESLYKSFKRKVMPIKQYKSKSQAIVDTLEYLEDYYNKKRMHSSLDTY